MPRAPATQLFSAPSPCVRPGDPVLFMHPDQSGDIMTTISYIQGSHYSVQYCVRSKFDIGKEDHYLIKQEFGQIEQWLRESTVPGIAPLLNGIHKAHLRPRMLAGLSTLAIPRILLEMPQFLANLLLLSFNFCFFLFLSISLSLFRVPCFFLCCSLRPLFSVPFTFRLLCSTLRPIHV